VISVDDLRYLMVLGVFLGTATTAAAVTVWVRRQAWVAIRRTAEQAALCRVSTSVAGGTAPEDLVGGIADEIEQVVGAGPVLLLRLEADGAVTVVGQVGHHPDDVAVGSRLQLDPRGAMVEVLRTGRLARRDAWVVVPIVVGGHIWGALGVGPHSDRFPDGAERWLESLAELVAIAIRTRETPNELAASRARLVAASDEMRRRIEDELHSGPKQRLASVALQLRMIQDSGPDQAAELRDSIGDAADELSTVLDELRAITRQLHPAVLDEGGLRPAVTMLARRASVPIDLDIEIDGRFPAAVEVAAYQIVDEAIMLTAGNPLATRARVSLQARDGAVAISVRDDGVGGAGPLVDPALIGLRDLVEALGGTIEVVSPPNAGTSVLITLPVHRGDGVLSHRTLVAG
jgi:signal transduction histidine kinase